MSDANECTTLWVARECVCVMFKRMKSVDWRRRVVVKVLTSGHGGRKRDCQLFWGGTTKTFPWNRKLALANSTPALLARPNEGFLLRFVNMALL